MIPKKCPLADDVSIKELAKFPLAGGNIKNVVLNAARMAAHIGRKNINFECFYNAIEREASGIMDWKNRNDQEKSRVMESTINKGEYGGLTIERKETKRPAKTAHS
jgi:hypothetical protein